MHMHKGPSFNLVLTLRPTLTGGSPSDYLLRRRGSSRVLILGSIHCSSELLEITIMKDVISNQLFESEDYSIQYL